MSLKTVKNKLMKKLRHKAKLNDPLSNKFFLTNNELESKKMYDNFPGALIIQLHGERT